MPTELNKGWTILSVGDMNTTSASNYIYRETLPLALALNLLGMAPPYTQSLKSASVEAFNGNSLNEIGLEIHALAIVPKDKVCACGLIMKTMLGGAHPFDQA